MVKFPVKRQERRRCSGISIVNFGQVIAGWEFDWKSLSHIKCNLYNQI